MSTIELREPEYICPTEFPEDPHHDCKESIADLERENAELKSANEALKVFISEQERENAELKKLIKDLINRAGTEAAWNCYQPRNDQERIKAESDYRATLEAVKIAEAALEAAERVK